jgi:hypothetical protein
LAQKVTHSFGDARRKGAVGRQADSRQGLAGNIHECAEHILFGFWGVATFVTLLL